MKVQIKKTFITCCLLFTTTVISAQQMLPADVPTPNTASLGRFGDVPVSYYTGRPEIGVSIYTLKVRDFSLPVSLSYDTGGVLVNSLPSWVGQNWTLNAGGVITRTVQGRYDELVYPRQANYSSAKNYYQSLGMLPQLISQKDHDYNNLKTAVINGTYDLAPDIFTFNFCGKTGKFFLGNDGNWKVLSSENLEILFDYKDDTNFIAPIFSIYPYKQAIDNKQCKTIKGFKIRDAEGYTYEFGMNLNAIEFTTNIWHMSQNEQIESWHAMSWYLVKISDRYGNELVTFNYDRGAYIIQAYNSYEYDHILEDNSGGFFGHYGQEYSQSNGYFPYGLAISSPVYLHRVKGANGVNIDFDSSYDSKLLTDSIYNDLYIKAGGGISGLYGMLACMVPDWGTSREGAFYYLQSDNDSLPRYRFSPTKENKQDILGYTRVKRLNKIAISSGVRVSGPTYTLGYRFRYGYTNNRMYLDSIQIQDKAINYSSETGNIGSYRFKYWGKDSLPKSYLTTAIDHWGYYNGKPYCIPNEERGFSSFTEKRNPNSIYTKCGLLSEIQYPTGGLCSLDYEPNTYGSSQSADRQEIIAKNGIGGGLRIKAITEYDSPAREVMLNKRTFEYTIPGTNTSSGELFAIPMYYWPKWRAWCVDRKAKHEVTTFRTSSIIPLSNSFGPSLGYSYVTEKVWNLSSPQQIMQKTMYHFSNLSDADMKDEKAYLDFSNNQPSPESAFSERGFKRGKLLEKTVYNDKNIKTESVAYVYRRDDKDMDTLYTLSSNLAYGNNGCSASFGFYGGGIYKLYYPQYDVEEKLDTLFYPEDSYLATSTEYLKSDKHINANFPYVHTTDARLLVEEIEKRGGSYYLRTQYDYGSFNDSTLISRLCKDYFNLVPREVSIYLNGRFVKKKINVYEETNKKLIVPGKEIVVYRSGEKDTLVSYSDYTSTGRPQIIKELGKPTMFLRWGYHDNYLMMKGTRNIPLSFMDNEVFDENKCLEKEYTFIKDHGNLMGYVYHPFLGVVDLISPSGYIKKYRYDSIGRLTTIQDMDGKIIESIDYNYQQK